MHMQRSSLIPSRNVKQAAPLVVSKASIYHVIENRKTSSLRVPVATPPLSLPWIFIHGTDILDRVL